MNSGRVFSSKPITLKKLTRSKQIQNLFMQHIYSTLILFSSTIVGVHGWQSERFRDNLWPERRGRTGWVWIVKGSSVSKMEAIQRDVGMENRLNSLDMRRKWIQFNLHFPFSSQQVNGPSPFTEGWLHFFYPESKIFPFLLSSVTNVKTTGTKLIRGTSSQCKEIDARMNHLCEFISQYIYSAWINEAAIGTRVNQPN